MKSLNSTALKHPTTQDRIITGLIEASDQAGKAADGRGHVYVKNGKGSPLFRLDVVAKPGKGFDVSAWRGNQNIVGTVSNAMGVPLADLL